MVNKTIKLIISAIVCHVKTVIEYLVIDRELGLREEERYICVSSRQLKFTAALKRVKRVLQP